MKIALVADALTRASLALEASIIHLTPGNYRWQLRLHRPDFLLVESAWQGKGNRWKYKIASYPDVPSRTNDALRELVAYARARGIPTVFWNKEDGVHFDRFIASAQLFDHVFTVDEHCIPHYRAMLRPEVTVDTMMFAIQPRIHFPQHTPVRYRCANFIGSYSHHIHDRRRMWQDMLFKAASDTMGLTIYDRNSARASANYRYPDLPNMQLRPAVSYAETAPLYRDYLVSLNVNTIEDSPSMTSRRLIEIIGSGGLAVTTPALSVAQHFAPYCHTVATAEEAADLLTRLKRDGRTAAEKEMIHAGAAFIHQHHTWQHRLEQISRVIGL